MTLDQYIKATRATGQDLAAKIGVSKFRLSRLRRGHVMPTVAEALKIAQATRGKVPVTVWVQDKGEAA